MNLINIVIGVMIEKTISKCSWLPLANSFFLATKLRCHTKLLIYNTL